MSSLPVVYGLEPLLDRLFTVIAGICILTKEDDRCP